MGVHSRTFFCMKSLFVHVYTHFSTRVYSPSIVNVHRGALSLRAMAAHSVALSCFPLSLLLPHTLHARTHYRCIERIRVFVLPSDGLRNLVRILLSDNVGNLGQLIWQNVACSSTQHRLAFRETRPRNA